MALMKIMDIMKAKGEDVFITVASERIAVDVVNTQTHTRIYMIGVLGTFYLLS